MLANAHRSINVVLFHKGIVLLKDWTGLNLLKSDGKLIRSDRFDHFWGYLVYVSSFLGAERLKYFQNFTLFSRFELNITPRRTIFFNGFNAGM